jgi:hypothetical protein
MMTIRASSRSHALLPQALCALLLATLAIGPPTPTPPNSAAPPAHADHAAHRAAAPVPAPEQALQLQAGLGQHSILAADMMRGRLRNDEDFIQAANAALGKNTAAMTQLVRSLFGEEAAAQFSPLWSTHVQALFNYARGLAEDDAGVRDAARTTLNAYERDLGGFFASASSGRLKPETAESALQMHVDHLLQQADAYAAEDYEKADALYRQSYAHTYGLGKALAGALLPAGTAAALEAPSWRLRSELGRLLGEHVSLAVAATRAGAANAADFTAAADTVNANTRDLTGAVDSLFGAAAAKSFQALWADHVDQLMAYTTGVVKKDAAARDEARAKLGTFEKRFASFLDSATSSRLDSETLAEALLAHDDMLVRGIDAYAAQDYQKAHEIAYATYQHMSHLAAQLAGAFGATIATRLPVGAAQTGDGSTAGIVGRR